MTSTNVIDIPEIKEKHNGLIDLINKGGFDTPSANEVTELRVGHIYVETPKPNHPTSYGDSVKTMSRGDSPLPVGYAGYGKFFLVNTDKSELAEYHARLRKIVDNWKSQEGAR